MSCQGGLHKLTEAQETVDILSSTAHEKQGMLAIKQAAADEALQGITIAMENAHERKVEVTSLSQVSTLYYK